MKTQRTLKRFGKYKLKTMLINKLKFTIFGNLLIKKLKQN